MTTIDEERDVASSRAPRSRFSAAANIINPPGRLWKRRPTEWAKERAGLELWSVQRQIIQSVRDNRNTAVHSCHEIGKSFIAAVTAAWWIDVHAPGEAFVVTTAPSDKQVKAILWREIGRLHKRLGLMGRTNLSEWYIGKELVAFGRKPSDYDPTAFQGLHARHMLVILDEACGIPTDLWNAASTLAANENGRILAIGNPDEENGEFDMNCRANSGWNVIGVGYEDTPNFTGEDVSPELKEMLIHPHWVEERRNKWGENSALFLSKCRGKFPRGTSPFVVIPVTHVERCQYLELPATHPIEAGIDVGAGGDRTVIWLRHGPKAVEMREFVNPDPMETTGDLARSLREWQVTKVKIDSIGIGWGIMGALRSSSSRHNPTGTETTHDAEVVGVNFGEGPTPGKEHLFLNKRAQTWWEVGRENSRLGLWDLAAIDEDTKQELTVPHYEILDNKGKVKIQPKEEIRGLIGRSPDSADALLLAFLSVDTVAELSSFEGSSSLLDRSNDTLDWGATGRFGSDFVPGSY